MSDILRFDRVSFTYTSGNEVLHTLSLTLEEGLPTAILGPNGSGKTTLLHLALGWLKPSAGQVLLAGKPLQAFTRREQGQWMGLVPQSEHTPFEYSLLEYVLLGRAPYLPPLAMPEASDYAKAEAALVQVGMAALAGRSILKLSGGERQLVLVARALAQETRLLLLDEPTSHLDLHNKSRLLALLRNLAAQGVTVIFTTHEPDVASALAQHVVMMKQGQVLANGAVGDILSSSNLTELYDSPVRVVEFEGRRVVLWD